MKKIVVLVVALIAMTFQLSASMASTQLRHSSRLTQAPDPCVDLVDAWMLDNGYDHIDSLISEDITGFLHIRDLARRLLGIHKTFPVLPLQDKNQVSISACINVCEALVSDPSIDTLAILYLINNCCFASKDNGEMDEEKMEMIYETLKDKQFLGQLLDVVANTMKREPKNTGNDIIMGCIEIFQALLQDSNFKPDELIRHICESKELKQARSLFDWFRAIPGVFRASGISLSTCIKLTPKVLLLASKCRGLQKLFCKEQWENSFWLLRKALGADPNRRFAKGKTLFIIFCESGNTNLVGQLLTETDVDFNAQDVKGYTGFMRACANGEDKVIQLLLEDERVDINAHNNGRWTGFMFACANGRNSVVQLVLKDERVGIENVNARTNDGMTGFMLACAKGKDKVVQLLLNDERVDINARDGQEWTGFMLACEGGYDSVIQLLLKDGRVNINAQKSDGVTGFMIACANGQGKVVQLLLKDKRVDVEKKDGNGKTGFTLALEAEHSEVVNLLKKDKRFAKMAE